jgi:hypothetical protein
MLKGNLVVVEGRPFLSAVVDTRSTFTGVRIEGSRR